MTNSTTQASPSGKNTTRQLRLNHSSSKFLRTVHAPGSVIYVFVKEVDFESDRHYVGYYDTDHLKKLNQDVKKFSGRASGIYYGLNPVHQSCLGRAANCLKPVSKASSATKADVTHRNLMLIDIDPVRSPGLSATDDEKEAARSRGRIVLRELKKAGFPKPVVVDSGNGFHLLYRVDLPVDDRDLIRNCLKALASKHDCEEVKIDTGVADAPRIAKLPGTMACKGISSSKRPHRMSKALKLPEKLEIVDVELLEELASSAPKSSAETRLPKTAIPSSSVSRVATTTQVARARAYIQKMEPAISGQNGRNQFLNAACRLVDDFALPAEQARPLLDEYNQRCVPPFDSCGVQDKLSSAIQKVAERNGPSSRLLRSTHNASHVTAPVAKTRFVGHVPDFALADHPTVMLSVPRSFSNGFWVWYWLLCTSLRSDVHVPDVMLRQCHWGADYDKNWKARQKKNLARQKQNMVLRPLKKPECSADTCMLYGTGVRHDHYVLWLDKYGWLDSFCSPEQQQPGHLRIFDVYGTKHKERREELQKSGQLFNVYWPALVLGSSRKVGWSWHQQRLVVGMVLELTRTKRKAGEDIAGEIIKGSGVAASNNTSHKTFCPLLDPEQEYVSFAGNGKRKGRGYRLVGKTGKGWIYRAGYLNAPQMDMKERQVGIKSFLKDLEIISEDLGLIPAAISGGVWKNLDEMIDCTHTGRGGDWLESCTMRIYAPADWRYRWRKFFSEKLGFQWIPASPDDSDISLESAQPRDPQQLISSNQLKRWLKGKKWTQQCLADEIAIVTGKKCSLRRVQRHLSGESHTESFYQEVDQVRKKCQEATQEVTGTD
ncbi:MAG: hypothetical protein HQ518_00765 [Rhodopirellula sp.]|nr:hypothetical protein [Rhodopirellula sp.]